MNIVLVAGQIHEALYSKITYKKQVINMHSIVTSELASIINQGIMPDLIVIIDEGVDQTLEVLDKELIKLNSMIRGKIVILTRNLEYKLKLKYIDIEFFDKLRVSYLNYIDRIDKIIKSNSDNVVHDTDKKMNNDIKQRIEEIEETEVTQVKREKLSLFNKFRKPKKEVEKSQEVGFKNISAGISRVIAVTGHRGVGVTSTSVNLAYEAAKKNLTTILVDLDLINRTTNLYFGEFIKQIDIDEHLNSSLVKCLARPQDYQNSACNINKNLWMTGLGYDFGDKKLLNQFFEATKLINMLTILRQHFNIIILDLPMEILSKLEECIPNIDCFALCVQNSQYSIITTLRNMDMYLSEFSISFLNAKSKLVITNYNDRAQYEEDFFTPERVSEIFASDLCEELTVKMPVAGYIKTNQNFDMQIETDIPITINDLQYENYYAEIILRILEGVH